MNVKKTKGSKKIVLKIAMSMTYIGNITVFYRYQIYSVHSPTTTLHEDKHKYDFAPARRHAVAHVRV